MKKLVLLLFLLLPMRMPAQEEQHPDILIDASAYPKVDITLPEVLDILSDYEIVHESRLMTYIRYFGLTVTETRTIYINGSVDQATRRSTMIHELLHVIYFRRGFSSKGPAWEAIIEARESEIYSELYGIQAK